MRRASRLPGLRQPNSRVDNRPAASIFKTPLTCSATYDARMLIISRAPGESLVIGRSQLVVRGLEPSLRLDLMEHGLVKEVAFTRREVAGQPTVQLRDAQVFIQRIQRGRVVLG